MIRIVVYNASTLIIPLSDLLDRERKRNYERRDVAERRRTKLEPSLHVNGKNAGIARLERGGGAELSATSQYGGVNYYLTQFFTCHRYFNAYLTRMQKTKSPYQDSPQVDALQTFFRCMR